MKVPSFSNRFKNFPLTREAIDKIYLALDRMDPRPCVANTSGERRKKECGERQREKKKRRDNGIIGTKRVNFEGRDVCWTRFDICRPVTVDKRGEEEGWECIEVAVMWRQRVEGCQRWQRGPLTLVSYLSIGQRVGGRDKGSS